VKKSNLGSGAVYLVASDKFYGASLRARQKHATRIPSGSRLKVLSPELLPSYPSDKPPARVAFAFDRKYYWQFEKAFLQDCKRYDGETTKAG
jgi:hypothetical protein